MRWIIRGWPGPSADGMGPRLAPNSRTLHFGAGKCRLGTGLGRGVKVEKPSSCHSPFGLDAAG